VDVPLDDVGQRVAVDVTVVLGSTSHLNAVRVLPALVVDQPEDDRARVKDLRVCCNVTRYGIVLT
jgi:hypothetical protein